jgi:hypothetical protein
VLHDGSDAISTKARLSISQAVQDDFSKTIAKTKRVLAANMADVV